MRKNVFAPVAAGILLAVAGSAQAGSKTTTFGVSATVNPNCLVSATPLDFGDYDGSAPVDNVTSDVNVRCSLDAAYTLSLSAGGGTLSQRLLSNGSDTLEYNLYTTTTRDVVWGDGTGTTETVTGSGNGMSSTQEITHTVYGLLPNSVANQDAPAGTYTDTITVTVDY
jgi:spore coat protein U-like protein